MTERAHAQLTRRGRVYVDPKTHDEYLSVTSIIREGKGSGGLTKYYAQQAALRVVQHPEAFMSMLATDPQSAEAWVARAADDASSIRARIGTAVHERAEAWLKQLPQPLRTDNDELRLMTEGDWDEVDMIWNQLRDLFERIEFKAWRVEPLIVERNAGYAGCADIVGESNEWRGRCVVDLKTKPRTQKPYGDVKVQLAAYAHGHVILEPDGTETDLFANGVRTDVAYAIVASPASAQLFEIPDLVSQKLAFLDMKAVSDWVSTDRQGINLITLVATDTLESVHQDIERAVNPAELTALYYRHVSRGKWKPEHTVHAAARKSELTKESYGTE